jgi:hypothetical protein
MLALEKLQITSCEAFTNYLVGIVHALLHEDINILIAGDFKTYHNRSRILRKPKKG